MTDDAPSCRQCGAPGPGEVGAACVAGWVPETDTGTDGPGRRSWLCPACARRHVRDIESKLDAEWW